MNGFWKRHVYLIGVIVIGLMAILGACTDSNGNDGDGNDGPSISEPYWILAIGGEGRDYAPSLSVREDGYVVVGMTTSYGLGDGGNNLDGSHDFLAVKLDKKGNHVWSRTIGGADDERGSYSVSPTADGGFLLTGTTRSFGLGGADLFVVKLDSSGHLDWCKSIGGKGKETGKTTLEVDGGYIALGDTNSVGAGKRDLLVVKFDFDGNLTWAKAIGGADTDKGGGISEVNGGYVIGGTIWSYGAGEADACLIKIDKWGNVIWSKTIGGNGDEGINWDGVRVLSDGGYVLGEGTSSYGASEQAICCSKLSSDCILEWSIMVDGPKKDAGWTMSETDDGYIGGGKYSIPPYGGDVVFLKLTKNGNFLWARTFGDTRLDEIEEIKQADSGYVMAGVTRMAQSDGDFLVAKVNSNGFVGGNSDPITTLSPTSIVAVTPQVLPFSPKQTDASSQIKVLSVSPTVTTPNLQINIIHKNESNLSFLSLFK